MAATVPTGNRVKQFHNDDPASPRYLLLDPPHFRWAGFDLRTLDTPKPGPDDSWEVNSGSRKLVRLYRDGTLVARVSADQEFLGWGVEPPAFDTHPRVNPVPAVEVHASFAHLCAALLPHLNDEPSTVSITLTLRGGVEGNARLYLTRYYNVPIWQVASPRRFLLQSDPATTRVAVTPAQLKNTPNRVAFLLAAGFASLFDMPLDGIPFVKGAGDDREIDLDQIRNL